MQKGQKSLHDCFKIIISKVKANPTMSEEQLYDIMVDSGFFDALGYEISIDVKSRETIPGHGKIPDYVCRDEYKNVVFVIEAKRPSDKHLEEAFDQLWERYVIPLRG